MTLPKEDFMRDDDENGYKNLGVLEGAAIKNEEMKEKVRSEYLRQVKMLASSKVYGRNLIKGVNT